MITVKQTKKQKKKKSSKMAKVLHSFRNLYRHEQYEEAAKEICTSLNACQSVATPEFFSNMVSRGHSVIFNAVAYVLTFRKLNIIPVLRPGDFLTACHKCDAHVISVYHRHPQINFSKNRPPRLQYKNPTAPLQTILDRCDPVLLQKCLTLIPQFSLTEPDPTVPLKYILKCGYTILIREMHILIDAFSMTNEQLVSVARKFPTANCSELKLAVERAGIEDALCLSYPRRAPQEFSGDDVSDIRCPSAMETLQRAIYFRKWLQRFQLPEDLYEVDLRIDASRLIVLVQLPFQLMTNVTLLLSRTISMTRALVGQEAEGEGPFDDLITGYFKQLVLSPLFDQDSALEECPPMLFPTCRDASGDAEREIMTIAYGLGVVFLKVLIDRRTISVGNEDAGVAFVPHPWFFRALVEGSFRDIGEKLSLKELFCESQLDDTHFYSRMWSWLSETEICERDARGIIMESKVQLGHRERIFQMISDGFHLVPIKGFTPRQAIAPMAESRQKLAQLFEEVRRVGHNGLRLLLVSPVVMSYEFVLSRFKVEGYEHFASTPEDRDQSLSKAHSSWIKGPTQIFNRVIREWCDEPGQSSLRQFLKFLTNSPVLSPMQTDRDHQWKIAIDFQLTSHVMNVHNCDKTVRMMAFASEDHLKEIVARTIKEFNADPVSRDGYAVTRATDPMGS
jgi:hypothetical protein